MERPFPQTATFTGFNAPRRIEASVYDLEIEGVLPRDLNGIFYRCGPDPRFAPIHGDDINLNGDGMVTMFRFEDGHVDFRSRYVQTEKYRLETAARRALFGQYRNPYTDDTSVAGKDRTTANTNIVFHGGRLLALKEDGRPYELDPFTLETLGRHDFGGALQSLTTSAHPKIDPRTGELITFGYEARGLATRDMSLQIVAPDGALVREEFFEAPYASFQHDFVVTQEHIVFALMPTTTDDARMRQGGTHWAFDDRLTARVGVMRRGDPVGAIRWFEAPCQGIGHFLNGVSEGDVVTVDLFVSERNQFPFVPNLDGSPFDRDRATPRLTRWTIDLDRNDDHFEAETLFPEFMEMPRTDDRFQMLPYRYGYCTMLDRTKPLNVAGTIGLGWNTLVCIDMAERKRDAWYAGEKTVCQEPQFVPRSPHAPEGEGYLLSVLTLLDGEMRTELVVLDAQRIAEGPIARIRMPFRLRGAIHGNWVSAETLAHAHAAA
jgi:carotenoid cleavage dioxygenase